jgi:hypothetical protein
MWAAAAAFAAFFGTTPGRAADAPPARALVEQAVRAAGGEAALDRARVLSRTGAGTMFQVGRNLPFTEESVMALPERLRTTLDLDKRYQVTVVLNGDKGWQASGGAVLPMTKERLEEFREEAYVLWLTTLTPLLSDKFTLSPLPDSSADGAPASGVKVTAKGHGDVKLYFNRQSHLLVKIERRAREAGLVVDKTYVLGDYKDVDGVKLPGRQAELLNGKKVIERASATYKLLPRVDEATFAKP